MLTGAMAQFMYQISAKGPRQAIETAWDALAWTDPSPADAVDAKEDVRRQWRLDAYAQTQTSAQACAEMISATAPELSPIVEPLADRDWVSVSLEGLPSVEAGRFVVAGSHTLTRKTPGKTGVLIEAGPAFGTGHHGTTLGCLLAYEEILRHKTPKTVLDVGTGSGVLAIAALKSGAIRAIGTDIDGQSVLVARENASKNKVGPAFRAYHSRNAATANIHAEAPFDLIFANILARPLIKLAPELTGLAAPGGHVILSGLLCQQEPLVRQAYQNRRYKLTSRLRRDGWSTLVFQNQS